MTRTKIFAIALALLVVGIAPQASAETKSEQKKREEARNKKAKLAAELNVLKANDQQLEQAVRALDAGVLVQLNKTQSAQQAVSAATTAVSTANTRLADTERKMADLRGRASAAAVRAYVHPGGDSLLELVRAKDLGEASRRQTFLAHVVAGDRDVVEQMRALREDISSERANLARAKELAEQRRRDASAKLQSLQQVQLEQKRLQSALDDRIRDYVAEVDALSKEEARLAALIKSRQNIDGGTAVGRISGAGLMWPASGPITSGFGMRWGRLHAGIDIAGGFGSPVRAAKGGTVILAGWNGGYGNSVVIDHGGGFSTLYAHLSRLSVGDGAVVKQGQQVGAIGSTGHSTGAHLHFETRVGGSAENPRRYLP